MNTLVGNGPISSRYRWLVQVILTISLLFVFPICAAVPDAGPLVVQTSAGWKVDYNGEKGIQFYTLTRPQGESVALMFSRWPAPGSQEQIPTYINALADAFTKEAGKNDKIHLVGSYTKGDFKGSVYSGEYVVFTIQGGLKQIMFMFSDGDGLWNGQYTGSAERWTDALEILKNLKKKN